MDFSGNFSGNFTASWHPEPTTRGSFTILSSCIITLTLCVWKAVHLNLPEHESSPPERKKTNLRYWMTRWVTPQKWRKVGWLMLGILAPEMVSDAGRLITFIKTSTITLLHIGLCDVHVLFFSFSLPFPPVSSQCIKYCCQVLGKI